MPQDQKQKTGSSADPMIRGHLRVIRGGLSGPRRHRAPDPLFDREVAGIYARWRVDAVETGRDRYASRAIANVAQLVQFSARVIDGHLEDAIAAGVPTELVKDLGRAFIRRVDTHVARHRLFKPAA